MIGRRLCSRIGSLLACSLLLTVPLVGCASLQSHSRPPSAAHSPTGPSGPGTSLVRLDFMNVDQGWAVTQSFAGENALWHSSNGGRTWDNVTPPGANRPGTSLLAGTDQPIQGAAFLSGTEAWVPIMTTTSASNSVTDAIYVTGDGGDSSTQVSSVSGGGSQLTFLDATHGFDFVDAGVAAGTSGMTLLATASGGRAWQVVASVTFAGPPSDGLYMGCDKTGAGWASPRVGWIGAQCNGGHSLYFFRTTDGGLSWAAQSLPLPHGMPAQDSFDCMCITTPPDFFGSSDGVEVTTFLPPQAGAKYVNRSTNGGQRWEPTVVPTGFGAVDFANFADWFAVKGRQLAWSRDSGGRWQVVPSGINLRGAVIDFINSEVGWAVTSPAGPHPHLIETVDAGQSWSGRTLPQ